MNEDNELKIDNLLCLDASSMKGKKGVRNMKCHGQGGNQEWRFIKVKFVITYLQKLQHRHFAENVLPIVVCNSIKLYVLFNSFTSYLISDVLGF